eukprot:9449450-Alexandrium_andersonii.AAC.1
MGCRPRCTRTPTVAGTRAQAEGRKRPGGSNATAPGPAGGAAPDAPVQGARSAAPRARNPASPSSLAESSTTVPAS